MIVPITISMHWIPLSVRYFIKTTVVFPLGRGKNVVRILWREIAAKIARNPVPESEPV
jgi:hypothetical protein